MHRAGASFSLRAVTIRRHLRFAALFLVLVLVSAGCMRTAEGPREEQRNPYYLAGKERLQAMDYRGAAESFERALQENPSSVLTHFELGVLYDTHLADYPAALYHYNRALKLQPSGYPADTIRYRIPACRQELVKADSLAVLNPSALREMEKLREENQDLRRQLGELRAAQARMVPAGPTPPANTNPTTAPFVAGSGASARPAAGETVRSAPSPGAGFTAGSASTPRGNEASGAGRTHTIRPGETIASLSRQYNVRIPAILAANRGLDPKRVKVGQTVVIPAPAAAGGTSSTPRSR